MRYSADSRSSTTRVSAANFVALVSLFIYRSMKMSVIEKKCNGILPYIGNVFRDYSVLRYYIQSMKIISIARGLYDFPIHMNFIQVLPFWYTIEPPQTPMLFEENMKCDIETGLRWRPAQLQPCSWSTVTFQIPFSSLSMVRIMNETDDMCYYAELDTRYINYDGNCCWLLIVNKQS